MVRNCKPLHRMSLSRRSSLLALVLLPVGLLLHAQAAHAESVTISPPKEELFGNAGDTITEKIKVSNDSPTDITYQVQVDNFTAEGDKGGVNLIDDKNAPLTNISLASWVTTEPSRFTANINSPAIVSYTIKIPKGAEPGGKYASVIIKRAGQAVQGGDAVDTRVGSLILLRVSGDVTEKLSLDAFKTDNNYYQKGPVSFSLRTTNTGNVHVAPQGRIVITDTFGHKVDEIALSQANVLPTSSRVVQTTWGNSKLIGRYTATLVATYGQQNETLSATTSFIVMPIWLVIVLLALLLTIVLLITQRRGIKRIINRLTSD